MVLACGGFMFIRARVYIRHKLGVSINKVWISSINCLSVKPETLCWISPREENSFLFSPSRSQEGFWKKEKGWLSLCLSEKKGGGCVVLCGSGHTRASTSGVCVCIAAALVSSPYFSISVLLSFFLVRWKWVSEVWLKDFSILNKLNLVAVCLWFPNVSKV